MLLCLVVVSGRSAVLLTCAGRALLWSVATVDPSQTGSWWWRALWTSSSLSCPDLKSQHNHLCVNDKKCFSNWCNWSQGQVTFSRLTKQPNQIIINPFPLSGAVQFSPVQDDFFGFQKDSEEPCCAVPRRATLMLVTLSLGYRVSQRVPRGRSYTLCSPSTASRQKAVFKCCCRTDNTSLQLVYIFFWARTLPCRFKISRQFIQITLVCKSVTKFFRLVRSCSSWWDLPACSLQPSRLLTLSPCGEN